MTYQVIIIGGPSDGRVFFESENLWSCQTVALKIDMAMDSAAEEDKAFARYYKSLGGALGAAVVDKDGNMIEY